MRTVHDQMGKTLTSGLLELAGQSKAAREIASQVQEADVVFQPNPVLLAENQERLGLLGRIAAAGPCLIELYSKTPDVDALRACARKQHNLHHDQRVAAQRAGEPKTDFPNLWVLSAGMPEQAIEFYELTVMRDWPAGMWQGKRSESLHVVALRLLPKTPDTLFLRLLGRGKTFREAFLELNALPDEHWAKPIIAPTVLAFWPKLSQDLLHHDGSSDPTEDPVSALKELSDRMIRQWQEEGREMGRKEGRREGRKAGRKEEARRVLRKQLSRRFGELPAPTQARLARAELRELEAWLERIISARSLDDVFAP